MWWKNIGVGYCEEAESDTSYVGGAEAPVAETADDSTESSVNWDDLANELDQDNADEESGSTVEGDVVVVEPTEGNPPAAAPTTPTPSVVPAPAPVTSSALPVAPVAQQPAPAPLPTPQPAVPKAESSAQLDYATWRGEKMQELAKGLYAVSDEDAAKLLTEPEVVFPQLAAKLHMEVLENAMRAMQVMVPDVLRSVQTYERTEQDARSVFHQANPDLADPRLEPAIFEMGTIYRKLNPSATPDVASVAIGNLVRASLGIAAPTPGAGTPPVLQSKPTPIIPFTPTRGGAGGGLPASQNVWEKLAGEFGDDD
jgi:hypothetical protein